MMASVEAGVKECSHYVRHCDLVCPACSEAAPCRLCHAESSSHELDRFAVALLECRECRHRQPKAKECAQCGISFGKYACLECSLFDDVDRGQFHCTGCHLCRVGGRDNFRHCDRCGYCMALAQYDGHQCLAEASSRPCPVCLEDIHSSRTVPQVLKCRHMLHDNCFKDMAKKGIFACPVCGKTMFDMTKEWRKLDRLVRETPMPACYRGVFCTVLCKDCNKECITPFHIEALKCKLCGSYNTARSGGSLLKKKRTTDNAASTNNEVDQPTTSEESSGEAVARQPSSDVETTTASSSEPAAGSNSARQVGSIMSSALAFLSGSASPTTAHFASSSPAQPTLMAAASPQDVPANLAAAIEAVNHSSSTARAAELLSRLDESWVSMASVDATSSADQPSLPAEEELHLYETVDVIELEESEQPTQGGPMALLDGLLQMHADSFAFADALEELSDDFSSMTSSDDDSEPPEVLYVEIDGRVARQEEAEASDWETDDDDEEHHSGAEEQFDTAESDSEQ